MPMKPCCVRLTPKLKRRRNRHVLPLPHFERWEGLEPAASGTTLSDQGGLYASVLLLQERQQTAKSVPSNI